MPSHAGVAPDEFKVSASSVNTLPFFTFLSFLPAFLSASLPPFLSSFLLPFLLSFLRHYGQEMVKMLLNHQKFKMLLEQSLSTCDLEDILTRIKKKVSAWQEKCLLCASIATAYMRSSIPNVSLSHSSSAESFCFWKWAVNPQPVHLQATKKLLLLGKKWGFEYFEYGSQRGKGKRRKWVYL